MREIIAPFPDPLQSDYRTLSLVPHEFFEHGERQWSGEKPLYTVFITISNIDRRVKSLGDISIKLNHLL